MDVLDVVRQILAPVITFFNHIPAPWGIGTLVLAGLLVTGNLREGRSGGLFKVFSTLGLIFLFIIIVTYW